ncbi:sigma-70 family RNA polymerase sigma factor [Leucothrix mucor]|uniref:sigma-70 family RNA polymerase sigma factor n=1 Tax=Leucothrix mucor TaxID=45248 RepID=UPI0003B38F2F|nr:sigma-70 family RNA polymerase sigma factor [Leucothrix mucor]
MTNSPCTPENQALADAYQTMRGNLLGWMASKVNNPADAEDLLQEVFKKALIANSQNATPNSMNAWLFTIARNTVIDFYRSQRTTAELPEDLQSEVDDHKAHQLLSYCLLPMVNQLPPIYRDALIAVDFEQHTMQSLADAEGVSLSAIKSRVSRGRKLLQKSLVTCCHIESSKTGIVEEFNLKQHSNGC